MDVENVEENQATTTTDAVSNETETVQTPPKRARSSGNRKTPTTTTPEPSGEYARKLRPRK
jgi:hypothetical protein